MVYSSHIYSVLLDERQMRNVQFQPEVIRELRRLTRDYKHREALEAALVRIYQAGYDNALRVSTQQIRKALNDNQSANTSNHNDRIELQSSSSEHGGSEGADATYADSGLRGRHAEAVEVAKLLVHK